MQVNALIISIHAAQEGCDKGIFIRYYAVGISIHAAQEGCDAPHFLLLVLLYAISIHAAQEGCDKKGIFIRYYAVGISIHAAQEGCDYQAVCAPQPTRHFNPRSPRGLRQYKNKL